VKESTPHRLLDGLPQSTTSRPAATRLAASHIEVDKPQSKRIAPRGPGRPASVDVRSLHRRRLTAGGVYIDETAFMDAVPPPEPTAADGILTKGFFAYVLRRDDTGRLHLAPAWPLWALLVLIPLWWALGLASFIFPILAVPMALELRRRRPIKVPPWFWIWALFLVWSVLSLAMFSRNPPNTIAGTTGGRLISIGVSLAEYASATITLLFIGNLTAKELPQRRVINWLSVLFVVTVVGGFLGTYVPSFQFTSPFEMLLPAGTRSDPYIAALVHPNAAQIQSVLGSAGGRAAAPWGYTNFWANALCLLLIWFIVGWGIGVSSRRRTICAVIVAATMVPVVYSLNRGLWIGLLFIILWVAIRLFFRGRVLALFAVIFVAGLGVVAFAETPLHDVFGERLQHGSSNNIRSFLGKAAIDGANHSPVIGWGGPRKTIGSNQSIAIGKTPNCRQCGQFSIGSTGQFWTVIFYQGWVGAAFFLAFFGFTIWTFRRDKTIVAQAGIIVVALTFVFMLFYASQPVALTLTMISIGLLWRSREDAAVAVAEPVG
jgi:hypothetical protein